MGSANANEASEGSHLRRATPPAWVAKVPGPLRAVVQYCYFDLILADDNFDSRLRKLVIVGTTMAIPGPQSYGITNMVRNGLSPHGITFPQALAYAGCCTYTTTWVACFAAFRMRPDLDSAVVALAWFIGTLLGCILQAIAEPDYPFPSAFVQLAMAFIMMRPPVARTPALLSVTALYLLTAYNQGVIIPGDCGDAAPRVALPHAYRFTELFQTMRAELNAFFIYVLVLVICELRMAEGARLAAASAATCQLAATVATALGRYDTVEAAETIEEAGDEGIADPALVAAFTTLVDNLNQYRPHLPNWMLPADDEDGHGECAEGQDDDADDGEDAQEGHGGVTPRRRGHHHHQQNQKKRAGADSSSRSSQHQRHREGDSAMDTSSATSRGSNESASGRRAAAVMAAPSSRLRQATTTVTRVRIVLAEFAFAVPTTAPNIVDEVVSKATHPISHHNGQQLLDEAMHAFVDRVHGLAAGLGAAVHGFVGDVLTVSWNAASAAAQPEAKAARFAARLRRAHQNQNQLRRLRETKNEEEADDGQRLPVVPMAQLVQVTGGAVASGPGRVQLAGQGRQQALTLSLDDGASLPSMMILAKRFNTIIANAPVYAEAHHAVRFIGAGSLHCVRPARLDGDVAETIIAPRAAVYEVGAEQEDGNDEWLYVLEQQQAQSTANPGVLLCRATGDFAAGKISDAARTIADVNTETQSPIARWFAACLHQEMLGTA